MAHDKGLLTLQILTHLQAFTSSSSRYTLHEYKILKWIAVKLLLFTAPALPLLFPSLLREVVESLHAEQPAVKRPKMTELGDYRNAIRPLATSNNARLSLKDHPQLVYRPRASRPGSVHSVVVEKRQASSSVMTTRDQSRKATRTSSDEGGMNIERESVTKTENFIDATPAAFGALQPEVESSFLSVKDRYQRILFCQVFFYQ